MSADDWIKVLGAAIPVVAMLATGLSTWLMYLQAGRSRAVEYKKLRLEAFKWAEEQRYSRGAEPVAKFLVNLECAVQGVRVKLHEGIPVNQRVEAWSNLHKTARIGGVTCGPHFSESSVGLSNTLMIQTALGLGAAKDDDYAKQVAAGVNINAAFGALTMQLNSEFKITLPREFTEAAD